MEITWYGHSCFRITERSRITIVTDPFSDDIGLPPVRVKADVVTISHQVAGHNNLEAVRGYNHVIYRPGEYEIGDVFISGVAFDHVKDGEIRHNIGYLFDYESLTVLHLGDLNHIPEQSMIERLGQVMASTGF